MMGNKPLSENMLLRRALETLRAVLPPGWSVERLAEGGPTVDASFDAAVQILAPDQRSAALAVALKTRLDPRGAEQLANAHQGAGLPVLAVAPWMSAATQSRLTSAGIHTLDLTGNVTLSLADPGLHIRTTGAEHDPSPAPRTPTLKGDQASALVRALCRERLPIGVRALASRAGVSPGYASRLLDMLDQQAAARREAGGAVVEVNLSRLLERWAEDAPLEARAAISSWIDPRGLTALLGRLAGTKARYAITSSLAASQRAPVAAPRLASIYVDDPVEFARVLDLRPADAGGNVLLLEPRDPALLQDTWQHNGHIYAALPQVAADLLSGPGRGPAEAAALIAWMVEHPEVWRG